MLHHKQSTQTLRQLEKNNSFTKIVNISSIADICIIHFSLKYYCVMLDILKKYKKMINKPSFAVYSL